MERLVLSFWRVTSLRPSSTRPATWCKSACASVARRVRGIRSGHQGGAWSCAAGWIRLGLFAHARWSAQPLQRWWPRGLVVVYTVVLQAQELPCMLRVAARCMTTRAQQVAVRHGPGPGMHAGCGLLCVLGYPVSRGATWRFVKSSDGWGGAVAVPVLGVVWRLVRWRINKQAWAGEAGPGVRASTSALRPGDGCAGFVQAPQYPACPAVHVQGPRDRYSCSSFGLRPAQC